MESENKATETVPGCCSQRWLLAYIGFLGFGVVYALRVNLSVGVVCMIKTPVDHFGGKNYTWNTTVSPSYGDSVCVAETEEASHSNDRAEFDWDSTTKSTLLASFFYGYIVTQVPGGMIADRFGGKRVLLTVISLSSILTILIPVAARTTVVLLYTIRVLLGLLTAMTFPAMHAMWGRWAPPLERSKLTTVCYSGTTLGFAFTFSTSGLLCDYGFDNGWASIFYITGGLGVLWSIAWWYIAADTPDKHRRITKAEVGYIAGNIKYNTDRKIGHIPWRSILSAPCLWACLTAHVCNSWTNYTLLTNIPTFMKEVLKYDIQTNGALSALPYICQFVSALFAGQAADYIRLRGWLNTTRTRKLFQTIAFTGAGGCLIGTGFCTCEERSLAVAMLSLAVLFMGFGMAGYVVNHVDFAPKYAGLMYGITNTLATVPGMVAPIYAGYMTPNNTPKEWRNVFFTCAGLDAFGILVFLLFASGELQDWAKDSNFNVDIEIDITKKKDEINSIDKKTPKPEKRKKRSLHERTEIARHINMEIVVRAAPKNDIAKVDEIIQEETGGGNSTKSEIITSHPDKHIPVVVIEEDNYRSDVGVGIATRDSKKIQPVLDGARNKISVNKDRNLDADSAASDQTGQNDLKSADDTIHDYFVEFQDEMLAEGKDSTNETTYAQNETSKTVDFGQTERTEPKIKIETSEINGEINQ